MYLSSYVKSALIRDIFASKECIFGTDRNHERLDDGKIIAWSHFYIDLPAKFIPSDLSDTISSIQAGYKAIKNVFQRSLNDIHNDAIETVLDLISQNSLYKGKEWEAVLKQFLGLYKEYHQLPQLPESTRDNYCWLTSVKVGGVIGKIRNHSIGTLLLDITKGTDLNTSVKKYEAIVAPTNYKRPKAIFTKKQVIAAEKKIMELGFENSLQRRFATVEDITINNILFANIEPL